MTHQILITAETPRELVEVAENEMQTISWKIVWFEVLCEFEHTIQWFTSYALITYEV